MAVTEQGWSSILPAALLDNHGVPGDWVTGSRTLDVVLLPILVAIAFPLLLLLLKKYIYQPSGEAVFLQQQKKQDKTWTNQQLEKKLQKWNESCWKLTIYTIFSAAAFLVSCQEPWLLNPLRFWDGATAFPLNYYVPFKIALFYLIEIGFYIQAIPFLFFVEVRRKDWMESFAHHIITLGLMYYSWYANFTRTGVIVMLIHDISDIFLEAAKLARYADKEAAAFYLFVVFAVSWVILRVILFPCVIIVRTLIDPVVFIAVPYNINPQPHYSAFGTMFLLLFFLHLYWTYLIFKVICKQLKTGSTEDVREEDSDDE